MILLDTNVVSELMRPEPAAAVLAWLWTQSLRDLATTAVTAAEIRYGLARLPEGRRRRELEERFRLFLLRGFDRRILPFDAAASELYGEIVAGREREGLPIQVLDAQIAAIARCRGAVVATRDTAGFGGCGVEVLNPWGLGEPTPRRP